MKSEEPTAKLRLDLDPRTNFQILIGGLRPVAGPRRCQDWIDGLRLGFDGVIASCGTL